MNIRVEIRSVLEQALRALDIPVPEKILIDYPADLSMGDFASPIALSLAKELGRKPVDIATDIAKFLTTGAPSWAESFAVAGPGFINITLSKPFWSEHMQSIASRGSTWGWGNMLEGQDWLVEHSSPNMFKPFHVGHLVNNFVGASLERVIRAQGAEVTAVSFPSDVSPGIAKAVWGLMDMGRANFFTIEDIGDAYARGSVRYKEDLEVKKEIDSINLELYQGQDTKAYKVYRKGLVLSEEYFLNITKRLGSVFSALLPESVCEPEGKRIVRENMGIVFEESDGAIIFRGSEHGLFDNVFINSAGYGTYLTKDIGLMSLKQKNYDFDRSLTVTDIEQKQHFQLLVKAAEQIPELRANKFQYVQHGRLTLTSGKISSRDGGVPLAEDLLEDVIERVQDKAKEKTGELNSQEAEVIAQAALKYTILRTSAGKNIVFDLERDLSFEGDSGPYLLYSYVRARAALAKINNIDRSRSINTRTEDVPELQRMLVRFPDYVAKGFTDYSPHHVAGYLQQLAATFSSFYAETKINDPDNPDMEENVRLVEAFALTMKNGLALLGIGTVERM